MCTTEIPVQYRPVEAAAVEAPGARSRAPESGGRSRKLDYPPAPVPLPFPVMDNHTHLDFRDGQVAVSAADAMDAAEAVGVGFAVQVGTDLASSRFTVDAVDRDHRLLGAVAIHPNEAPVLAASGALEDALAEIEELAHHQRIRAIGETGLDYFRTPAEGIERQQYSFRRHLDIAKRLGLAVQIHDRDAHDDVVSVLRAEGSPERVVLHCFSGDADFARICNDSGWFMSFSGTVTFKNAGALREALEIADPSLILTETDAPFLTPHPFRGQPNASYAVPYTVRFMAEHLGADLEELCRTINANTRRAYGEWD
ncbi:TatD DNase family protein [Arthrobacter pigmenti]|uniref:TatD DNase family protein n=1 Tax=Arthrobacter pigmenti TaxID=271432 RepID=A0A846RNP6_9MICC|nr:TatD family hydrolase [Arthrobacter pigmenti]NJC21767.1 TatD DNase family protein [Arthrobacter pigmenti]